MDEECCVKAGAYINQSMNEMIKQVVDAVFEKIYKDLKYGFEWGEVETDEELLPYLLISEVDIEIEDDLNIYLDLNPNTTNSISGFFLERIKNRKEAEIISQQLMEAAEEIKTAYP